MDSEIYDNIKKSELQMENELDNVIEQNQNLLNNDFERFLKSFKDISENSLENDKLQSNDEDDLLINRQVFKKLDIDDEQKKIIGMDLPDLHSKIESARRSILE